MQLIAHRAGNLPSTIPAAHRVADVLELDLHLFRGRLEVRHAKVLWPTSVLWEQWLVLPSDTPRPTFGEVLGGAPDDAHLWVDMKGFSRRLVRRMLATVGERRPLTVSSRSWWTLGPARRAGGIRTFRSIGAKWQLWVIRLVRRWAPTDGIGVDQALLTPAVAADLLARTPLLVAWGVKDLARARGLAELGVTGLIVDDLDLIAEIDDALGPTG